MNQSMIIIAIAPQDNPHRPHHPHSGMCITVNDSQGVCHANDD